MHLKYIAVVLLVASTSAPAATIYTDNFDAPDSANFDTSSQAGRHTGLLAANVVGRSGGVQHSISSGQLNLFAATAGTVAGRMRFHDASNTANRWDFATGAAGAQITTDGGMVVSFDWTSANNTSGDWVGFSVGIPNDDLGAVRVANASTDSGILFRNNGATQVFDNGVSTTGGSFAVTSLTHHIDLIYTFNLFADTTAVTMKALIDNTLVATQNFDWNGNAGTQFMEMGTVANGTRIDNFSITTAVPEPTTFALGGLGALGLLRRRR